MDNGHNILKDNVNINVNVNNEFIYQVVQYHEASLLR